MGKRRLAGKRAILTGASGGLGMALACKLAEHGVRLILNARRQEQLDEVAVRIAGSGGECYVIAGDVSDQLVQQRLVKACIDHFGGLDCLINNAGIGAMGRFDQASPERMKKIFDINFFAVTELTRKCLSHLSASDDALIVNIGSVLGHRAAPLKSEYCASKFAVHGFSDALRAELAETSVEVLLVSPSTIDSDFFDASIEDTTGKNWKHSAAMNPDYVADRVIKAMIKRKHEIILPFSGKLLVWLDRLLPGLANRLVARYGS